MGELREPGVFGPGGLLSIPNIPTLLLMTLLYAVRDSKGRIPLSDRFVFPLHTAPNSFSNFVRRVDIGLAANTGLVLLKD